MRYLKIRDIVKQLQKLLYMPSKKALTKAF